MKGIDEPVALDWLTRSRGFCLAHGDFLLDKHLDRTALAVVHQILARRVREELLAHAATRHNLLQPAECPACQANREREASAAFFLGKSLDALTAEKPSADYPVLCLPHLGITASVVRYGTARKLMDRYERTTLSIPRDLGPVWRQDCARASRDVDWRALSITIGHKIETDPYPRISDTADRDLAPNLESALRDPDYCPICLEMRRAWLAWMSWLVRATTSDHVTEDVLPTCAAHAWAAVHSGSPALALAVMRRALDGALMQIRWAQEPLERPRGAEGKLRFGALGRHGSMHKAREALTRFPVCPLCDHLSGTQDRTLSLLLTMLEERRHREALESGHGLCQRHFERSFRHQPAAKLRAFLYAAQAAKLGRLEWELAEYLRKRAWKARPEVTGPEYEATRWALLRFSGSLDRAP